MWILLKADTKNINMMLLNFKKILGEDVQLYQPKMLFQNFKNNKVKNKEINLLGDYFFCYHKKFEKKSSINLIKFCVGLKLILEGYQDSQPEIIQFINRCKNSENEKGYLSANFFNLKESYDYKFMTGPFTNMIFKIINLHKDKINILLGNLKTTIKKNQFLFKPL